MNPTIWWPYFQLILLLTMSSQRQRKHATIGSTKSAAFVNFFRECELFLPFHVLLGKGYLPRCFGHMTRPFLHEIRAREMLHSDLFMYYHSKPSVKETCVLCGVFKDVKVRFFQLKACQL